MSAEERTEPSRGAPVVQLPVDPRKLQALAEAVAQRVEQLVKLDKTKRVP